MNSRNQNRVARKQAAFTLIELLVVITIIGVLAGLVVGMSGLASRKMRDMRVNAELQNLVAGIESYKLQTGFYPPDNSRTDYAGSPAEQEWARTAQNTLFYELSGATFDGAKKTFTTLNHSESVSVLDLGYFGASTIANSGRDRKDVPFRSFTLKGSQSKEVWLASKPDVDLDLLVVPVPGPKMIDAVNEKKQKVPNSINPWHYDSSSTNRHNPNGFDLWAEYLAGGKTNLVGNWKD